MCVPGVGCETLLTELRYDKHLELQIRLASMVLHPKCSVFLVISLANPMVISGSASCGCRTLPTLDVISAINGEHYDNHSVSRIERTHISQLR